MFVQSDISMFFSLTFRLLVRMPVTHSSQTPSPLIVLCLIFWSINGLFEEPKSTGKWTRSVLWLQAASDIFKKHCRCVLLFSCKCTHPSQWKAACPWDLCSSQRHRLWNCCSSIQSVSSQVLPFKIITCEDIASKSRELYITPFSVL